VKKPFSKARAVQVMTDLQQASPTKTVLGLMTPDEGVITPEMTGAQKWFWTDRGELKVSARLFAKFGTVVVVTLLVGFIAALLWLIKQQPPALWQEVSMGLSAVVLAFFVGLSVYNRIVRALRPQEAVSVLASGEGDPADGESSD